MKGNRVLSLGSIFTTLAIEQFAHGGVWAAILTYMTSTKNGGLGLEMSEAFGYYSYIHYFFLIAIPAALFSDFISGQKWGVAIGLALSATGIGLIPFVGMTTFFIGIGLVAIGSNLVRNNLMVLIGRHYHKWDNSRDIGFLWQLLFVSIGSAIGVFSVKFAGMIFNWKTGFIIASAAMFSGLLLFLLGTKDMEILETDAFEAHDDDANIIDPNNEDSITKTPCHQNKKNILKRIYLLLFILGTVGLFFSPLSGMVSTSLMMFSANMSPGVREISTSAISILSPIITILAVVFIGAIWLLWKNIDSWQKIGIGMVVMLFAVLFTVWFKSYELQELPSLWKLAGAVSITSMATVLIAPTVGSLVTRISPVRYSSTFYSVYGVILKVVTAIFLALAWEDFKEDNGILYIMGALSFIIGVLFLLFYKKLGRYMSGIKMENPNEI